MSQRQGRGRGSRGGGRQGQNVTRETSPHPFVQQQGQGPEGPPQQQQGPGPWQGTLASPQGQPAGPANIQQYPQQYPPPPQQQPSTGRSWSAVAGQAARPPGPAHAQGAAGFPLPPPPPASFNPHAAAAAGYSPHSGRGPSPQPPAGFGGTQQQAVVRGSSPRPPYLPVQGQFAPGGPAGGGTAGPRADSRGRGDRSSPGVAGRSPGRGYGPPGGTGHGPPGPELSTHHHGGRGPGRGGGRDGGGRGAPYGRGGPSHPHVALLNAPEAARHMQQYLAGKDHRFQKDVPAVPSTVPALRPSVKGTLGSSVPLTVNMYKLELTGKELYHYDVKFEQVRPPRQEAPAAAAAEGATPMETDTPASPQPGASGTSGEGPHKVREIAAADAESKNPRPPVNAREILLKWASIWWNDSTKPPVCWAFDGARNLVTPEVYAPLPWNTNMAKEFEVPGIIMPGKTKPTTWRVTFHLTKDPLQLAALGMLKRLLANKIKEGNSQELHDLLTMFSERRQCIEWILRDLIMSRYGGARGLAAALEAVSLVGSSLYFNKNPANMNIGGGLVALNGVQSGVKLTESGLVFTADITCSAFLRTDINIAQWMDEVGGVNSLNGRGESTQAHQPGNSKLEVAFWSDRRLQSKLARGIRNRKVVYKSHDGNSYRYLAAGFVDKPSTEAMFELHPRKGSNAMARQVSVAQFFAEELRCPLKFPRLPPVMMKLPKNSKMDKVWLPPEFIWFDKNQRITNVTHPGGTEQMIKTACKEPSKLLEAIEQAVTPATTNQSPANTILQQGFGIDLPSKMMEVQGRVLPGPWLEYQGPGQPGALGPEKALNAAGAWNMSRDRLRFSEPATLRSWGILAVLDRNQYSQQGPGSLGSWMGDMVRRMQDLGINLGDTTSLLQNIMNNVVWVHESAGVPQLQAALQRVRDQAFKTFGQPCQLVLCFIRDKPSPLYRDIKIAAELDVTREMQERGQATLGLMTQVIVARRAGLGGRQMHADPSKRSQYQANLCMKINAKLGGINTKWATRVGQLMKTYFGLQRSEQVPSLMVFGIDLTHPGKVEGGRSIAAVVGSLDTELCRYGHQVWEEPMAGSETVSTEKLVPAIKALLEQHYSCTRCKPSCLMVYRDGVSDAEMDTISRLEVNSILTACKEVQADGAYRPRVVYIVVQKRHNVRFFTGKGPQARNVSAGTVVDHTVVSPWLFDFYLNSHTAIKGTSRAARYICLLDELGFGADGLQTFTYWLCYLYCRCARSVSIVAPVYYAHLLAFRARITAGDSGDDVMSMASGISSRGGTLPNMREYAKQLDGKMFFV